MLAYAHDHYRDGYDFFLMIGDDDYVAVENLRAYLDGPEVAALEDGLVDRLSARPPGAAGPPATAPIPARVPRPLLLGTPMLWRGCPVPAGGGGYVLNRAALDLFADGLDSFCPDSVDSREDVFVGSFFCERGVRLSYTLDDSGGLRFGPSAEFSHDYGGVSQIEPKRLKRVYGIDIPLGAASASSRQITFHLWNDRKRLQGEGHTVAEEMYRYHAILHDWCNETEGEGTAGRT